MGWPRSRSGNDTAYPLTALFSGPIDRRVEVAPGTSASVELPPGAYKLVGRVNTPGVSPSYGEHTFRAGQLRSQILSSVSGQALFEGRNRLNTIRLVLPPRDEHRFAVLRRAQA